MSEQRTPGPRLDANAWLGVLAGVAMCAYGGYRLFINKGNSPTGAMIFCAGLTFFPWPIVGLLGGVGLLGVAGWIVARGPVQMDWLIVALCVIFGLMAIVERWKRIKR